MNELYIAGWKALLEHLPSQQAGTAAALFALFGISGLVLLWRGAKLAVPSIVILVGAGCAAIGYPLAAWAATNAGTTMAVCGVCGLIFGALLFRFWLSVAVASCFVAISLGIYTDRVLSPHLQSYLSRNYDTKSELVSLPGAESTADSAPRAGLAVISDVWNYLSTNVQQFQVSFGAIVLVMAVAGMLVGWKMPNFSRSIGAATLGTGVTFVSLTALLDWYWPTMLAQLKSMGSAGWIIITAVWLVSLLNNYRSITPPKKTKPAADAPTPAQLKTAVGGQPI